MSKKVGVALVAGIPLISVLIGYFVLLRKQTYVRYDRSYTWNVQYDSGREMLIRGQNIDSIENDARKLVAALNGTNADPESFRTPGNRAPADPPKIKLKRIAEEAADIEIINAEYLTQRMGASGAQAYLASVTYTLTENPGVKKVNFILKKAIMLCRESTREKISRII
jgi:spore germination protein GerM